MKKYYKSLTFLLILFMNSGLFSQEQILYAWFELFVGTKNTNSQSCEFDLIPLSAVWGTNFQLISTPATTPITLYGSTQPNLYSRWQNGYDWI